MAQYPFKQVDVFTGRPFFGNPVAVILDASGLSTEEMQRIARWTNLSETTFVLPPSSPAADYRLRIFTPAHELPFAGHPTIGSAHAVLENGLIPKNNGKLIQECEAGLLQLTVSGDPNRRHIAVLAPEAKFRRDDAVDPASLSNALGAAVSTTAPPLVIDVGPVWLVALLEREADLGGLNPDLGALTRLSKDWNVTGVTAFILPLGADAKVRLRTFAPAAGVPEDPVCGSCNAAVGAFLAHYRLLHRTGTEYTATQGTEIGRDGKITVRVADEGRRVTIGGRAVTVIDGVLRC